MDGDGPRFGAMIGLVAIVVATVILVFFGIGYLLGRVFLLGVPNFDGLTRRLHSRFHGPNRHFRD